MNFSIFIKLCQPIEPTNFFMKIAININELTLKQNTGVKTYTREIVEALGKVDKENEYILYANCRNEALPRSSGFKYKNFKLKAVKSQLPFWTYTKLPQEIKNDQPAVLFMPIQATPFFRKPKNIKIVVTVHDLAFLLFPKHFTFKDRFLLNFHTKRAVQMADVIITPSEATKKDIIKFYEINEDKIKVVYHGVETRHCLVSTTANTPYLLFVGSIQPRKNLIRLIEAFEILKNPGSSLLQNRRNEALPRLKLIIAGGKGWLADKTYKRAKESKFSKDIIFKGNVSDKDLVNLYKNATVFVMPSLYEGFGLPVLEAMSFGIPCVVSDNSSLSEIAGTSALLVDASNSGDIAEKINLLLSDSKLRKDLSWRGIKNAKKFNWAKAAEKTLEVLSIKY